MNFKVKKAEAIYTGGGIYVFCGITTDGQYFLASDDPEWVMLTDEPTMTDELTDDEWNDRWYADWQEENMTYETSSDDEARGWLLAIYQHILSHEDEGKYCYDDIRYMRDVIINEMSESDNAWCGYKMSNEKLMEYFVRINAKLDANWTAENAKEYDRIYDELLRRMEDFVDEPRRQ